jgi:tetratricopeptide (TPR) repeat protein
MTILILSLFVALAGEDLAELIPGMEHATVVASVKELEQHHDTLLNIVNAGGRDSQMTRYALAYVDWRLHPLLSADHRQKEAEIYLAEAQAQLRQLIAADPSNAEAHALLASVYGSQIGTSAWKGMTLGPKASAAIDAALKTAPDNPRVVLQAGISASYAPKAFGGGIEKAEKSFRRAEQLFAAEPLNQPWPSWGKLDVLAWMGQVLAAKGDREGARRYYERALQIQPDYAWVRRVLLPALDKPVRQM